MHGTDDDDASAVALRNHLARCQLAPVKDTPQRDAEGGGHVLLGQLEERLAHAQGGVGYEDVQPPQLGHGSVYHLFIRGPYGHVTLHHDRAPSESAHLLCNGFSLVPVAPVIDADVGALASQLEGTAFSDSAVGASDERYFAFESHSHQAPPTPTSKRWML
jgi:hypothetical protein